MMNLRLIVVLALFSGFSTIAYAQAIDNAFSYKNISDNRYIRLNYENDFFSATDKYYTQGMSFEIAALWVQKFPLRYLLVHPHWNNVVYGLGIEHDGYTPSDITNPEILRGDRPFAACLFLKTFSIATDTIHRRRFSTTLSTGVIGPAAFGAEMQTGIHRALGDELPRGWPNQIRNDAILNYQVDYERQLISAGHVLSLDADGMGRAGTLSDKAALGITMMGGYFNSPFSNSVIRGRNFRIYAYEHPEVDFVGYDATLQGGLFNRATPYTISANDIERVVLQNRFGFVLIYRRLYLEYFQSFLSSEFTTGNYHVWGGVEIAAGL